MNLNMDSFKQFIKDEFGGVSTVAAKELNLNTSTVTRVLANKISPGLKFYGELIKYCKKKDIDYTRIIDF